MDDSAVPGSLEKLIDDGWDHHDKESDRVASELEAAAQEVAGPPACRQYRIPRPGPTRCNQKRPTAEWTGRFLSSPLGSYGHGSSTASSSDQDHPTSPEIFRPGAWRSRQQEALENPTVSRSFGMKPAAAVRMIAGRLK